MRYMLYILITHIDLRFLKNFNRDSNNKGEKLSEINYHLKLLLKDKLKNLHFI